MRMHICMCVNKSVLESWIQEGERGWCHFHTRSSKRGRSRALLSVINKGRFNRLLATAFKYIAPLFESLPFS